ncbi:MAG: hypothetical protein DCC51_09355 [Anaerolineae bacterium]|nr:MAG: hypothetical protein DCC51_09355 [Anaerolineae bacterium]
MLVPGCLSRLGLVAEGNAARKAAGRPKNGGGAVFICDGAGFADASPPRAAAHPGQAAGRPRAGGRAVLVPGCLSRLGAWPEGARAGAPLASRPRSSFVDRAF